MSKLFIALVLVLSLPLAALADNITINGYTLVSSVRVNRTVYDYTYSATISNTSDTDTNNVTANLTTTASNITVLNGSLTFNTVPAGATITSSNTFKVRVDRTYPFDTKSLIWKMSGNVPQTLGIEAGNIIGKNGGVVEVTDQNSTIYGAKCIIPAGALAGNQVVTIKVATDLPTGAQSDTSIGQTIDFGPTGTTFNNPITISIPYNKQDIDTNNILSEDLLKIYNYDTNSNMWIDTGSSSVDVNNNIVSTNVNHFSIYKINGDKLYSILSANDLANGTPSPDNRTNILFIHGIQLPSVSLTGSWSWSWSWPPLKSDVQINETGYADNVVDQFYNLPSFLNTDYRVWYLSYDSWSDIDRSANSLRIAINKIKQKTTNGNSINIIAHSEGGLVTRSYIEGPTYNGDISKAFFLGTPNHGVNYISSSNNEPIAIQQMVSNSNLLNGINNSSNMPYNAVIYNIFNGDLLTPLIVGNQYGDGVVTEDSAKMNEFGNIPGIYNLELKNNLYHFVITKDGKTLIGPDGIAYVGPTANYPLCNTKDTCNHPSWLTIKGILAGIASADSWVQKADFLGTSMREPLNFSIGGKGYVGITQFSLQDFWEYDPIINSWNRKADLPSGFSFESPSFVIGNKAYIIIGVTVWQYDPDTNTWTRNNDIPGADKRDAFGFSIGNKGYIGGGFYNTNELYAYDPDSDQWTKKNGIPKLSPYYNNPNVYSLENVTFTIGTKAYVTGTNMAFWEYDPGTDTWSKKLDYYTQVNATYATAFSIGQKGYIFNTYGEMWEYDPLSNVLTLNNTFPGTKVCYSAGFSINGIGYIGLGGVFENNTCTLTPSNAFWGYTP